MAKSFGQWQVDGQIGEGGMGHVYKVKHLGTGQLGALKRLKNPNRLERFKQEVRAVRVLEHPGIIPILDCNLDADPFYAVYEFEPGGSLGDIPTDELLSIPLSQRLDWCVQVCSALEFAHSKSMIHRDIKPENLMISKDRTKIRICDFGLVYFHEGERHTETMEQVGSRFYIAPASEDGRANEVGVALDLYSLGKVVYYVVRGRVYSRERHREPEHDLAKVLDDPYLEVISQVLDGVVTEKAGAIKSATSLKLHIDLARKAIESRRPIAGVVTTYKCVFCGVGEYKERGISGETAAHNRGYPEGSIGDEQMVFLEWKNAAIHKGSN